ncbi:hypothetical protein ACH4UM_22560 [Streptomyces sp. NPDC020801]|uniref:hypothetical protein n=1 Tax=unclassified Streptomyces TaxID=2593676 RepID=UPI0037BDCFDB
MALRSTAFSAWDRVYAFFRRRRRNGLVKELHDWLRGKAREAAGRDCEPTAAVTELFQRGH